MMHQVIVRAKDVANAINKIVDVDIYQLIPFRRRDIDLFLIFRLFCCPADFVIHKYQRL